MTSSMENSAPISNYNLKALYTPLQPPMYLKVIHVHIIYLCTHKKFNLPLVVHVPISILINPIHVPISYSRTPSRESQLQALIL